MDLVVEPPVVTEAFQVVIVDDEIVLVTTNSASSLTPDAAEGTGRRLIANAETARGSGS